MVLPTPLNAVFIHKYIIQHFINYVNRYSKFFLQPAPTMWAIVRNNINAANGNDWDRITANLANVIRKKPPQKPTEKIKQQIAIKHNGTNKQIQTEQIT